MRPWLSTGLAVSAKSSAYAKNLVFQQPVRQDSLFNKAFSFCVCDCWTRNVPVSRYFEFAVLAARPPPRIPIRRNNGSRVIV
jgi:hypothetical protein